MMSVAVVAFTAAVAGLLSNPSPSYAQSAFGCAYPYACIYSNYLSTNPPIVGRFQDVTTNWQYLSTFRTGAWAIVNTRNDDVVYYLYRSNGASSDTVGCILPNENIGRTATLKAIRISSSNACTGWGNA